MIDEDNETENAGQDFYEGSTEGTTIETLGHRFAAMIAAIKTFGQ